MPQSPSLKMERLAFLEGFHTGTLGIFGICPTSVIPGKLLGKNLIWKTFQEPCFQGLLLESNTCSALFPDRVGRSFEVRHKGGTVQTRDQHKSSKHQATTKSVQARDQHKSKRHQHKHIKLHGPHTVCSWSVNPTATLCVPPVPSGSAREFGEFGVRGWTPTFPSTSSRRSMLLRPPRFCCCLSFFVFVVLLSFSPPARKGLLDFMLESAFAMLLHHAPTQYPARAVRQWIPPSIPPERLASGSRRVSLASGSRRVSRQSGSPVDPARDPAEYPASIEPSLRPASIRQWIRQYSATAARQSGFA